MVAAHRGDWRNEPENSVRGFLSAVKMDVDIVELDLEKSKDGQIIILHDHTLNRSTTGKGKPGDYTLAELKTFRLRDGLGVPTINNTIPTLEEAMLVLKGKPVLVNLDHSFPFYREAYEVLKKTGTLNQALFKSEEPFDTLKAHYPELIGKIRFMAIADLDDPGAKAFINHYLENMKPWAFELIFSKDTSTLLKDNAYIRKTGSKIWINALWPVLNGGHDDNLAYELGNTKESWGWLIAHGATVIQTDRPEALIAWLRKKGLHK
ncbi:MAG TPA: glycerophosphodiester phosphodiesterase family protein [Mucilaginibacter sp.]|jgi:glycerophosphoryl diester phosphodiesterase|nr:glycerophosphodiester phosphodiesterase family protein [Mucilaginibacter sp.]